MMALYVSDLWKFLLIHLTITKIKSILGPKTNHTVSRMCEAQSILSRMMSYI